MSDDINSEKTGAYLEWQSKRTNNTEKVAYFATEFTNSVKANREDRQNAEASFNGYVGIGGRQWPNKAKLDLEARKMPVNTFNHIKPKVDKVAGQLILNPNKISFGAINQDKISAGNIMDSLYEYDYERGNWNKAKNRWIRDILIHTGVIEMYVDYTHSKLGNISLRALNRVTDIEFDGYWNNDNIVDARMIFKPVWLTARQIKDQFGKSSQEIDMSIREYERLSGMDSNAASLQELSNRYDNEFYNSESGRYRVIECVYMQEIEKKRNYSEKMKRFLNENENPDTRRQQGDVIKVDTIWESVCKVMTIAPGLDNGLVLENGLHPVQVGRLPFFIRSSDNTMGVRQGKATGMLDAQTTVNKRISMQTSNQITSANGALLYHEDLFKNSAVENDFVQNRTVPGKSFPVDNNADLRSAIAPVPTGTQPEGLQQSIDSAIQFMDTYINDTDASSGRSGGANESSVLFVNKRNQSAIAHVTVAEEIAQGEKEMAEAYFYLAKAVYKGVNRRFRNSKTGEKMEINKRVQLDEFQDQDAPANATVNKYLASNQAVINEIENLPRHDIIIKRSELGLDQKEKSLSIFSEMSQRTKNPILQSQFEKAMIPLLDIPEDQIPDMMAAGDIFTEFQLEQIKAQISAMKLQTAQGAMQLQQMQAQAGQPTQEGQQAPQPQGDARTAGNGAGQGSLPQSIASDSSGSNNQAASDG